MKAKVYVTLKKGVLDPQGSAVGKTLHRTGFEEVKDVRIGKYIELEVADGTPVARIEEMCRKLLANTVIEDFRVELPPPHQGTPEGAASGGSIRLQS